MKNWLESAELEYPFTASGLHFLFWDAKIAAQGLCCCSWMASGPKQRLDVLQLQMENEMLKCNHLSGGPVRKAHAVVTSEMSFAFVSIR